MRGNSCRSDADGPPQTVATPTAGPRLAIAGRLGSYPILTSREVDTAEEDACEIDLEAIFFS